MIIQSPFTYKKHFLKFALNLNVAKCCQSGFLNEEISLDIDLLKLQMWVKSLFLNFGTCRFM